MNFATYGPFALRTASAEDMVQLWSEVNEVKLSLSDACGVYVFVRREAGRLLPWYVGKTEVSFGWRISQHINQGKFHWLFSDPTMATSLFFIARKTNSGRLMKATKMMRESGSFKSISRLEFSLIGACLSINPELINKQEKAFHSSMHVPGYWNSEPKNYDDSARQLAGMLQSQV